MDLVFTRHARNQMRLYGISESQAQTVVGSPDEIIAGADGKSNALKLLDGRKLRAVYLVENDAAILITIHPKD